MELKSIKISFTTSPQRCATEKNGGGVSKGGRIFIVGVVLAAASLWVSASIAGASMGVSKVILLGMFVLILVMTVVIDRLFGWRAILAAIVTKEPLARRRPHRHLGLALEDVVVDVHVDEAALVVGRLLRRRCHRQRGEVRL